MWVYNVARVWGCIILSAGGVVFLCLLLLLLWLFGRGYQ